MLLLLITQGSLWVVVTLNISWHFLDVCTVAEAQKPVGNLLATSGHKGKLFWSGSGACWLSQGVISCQQGARPVIALVTSSHL